jgi:hypothetical protein
MTERWSDYVEAFSIRSRPNLPEKSTTILPQRRRGRRGNIKCQVLFQKHLQLTFLCALCVSAVKLLLFSPC